MCTNASQPAKYIGADRDSFAFKTLSYRLPVIITKVIDTLYRQRKQIPLTLNIPKDQLFKAEEETKELIEKLAKLKYELQTNKQIEPIVSELSDTKLWNEYIKNELKEQNGNIEYFSVSWLFSECYIYRAMREIFVKSKYFKNYDQFTYIKQDSFKVCLNAACDLAKHLKKLQPSDSFELEFYNFAMNSLWGNKFDLSLSCGETIESNNVNLNSFKEKFLVNDLNDLMEFVRNLSQKSTYRIDIILDNAGYELFTDFCLIEALHSMNILSKSKGNVYFYVKKMPWFVSDTNAHDIEWLLNFIDQELSGTNYDDLKSLNAKFRLNFSKKHWIIVEHDFWTLPHDFSELPIVASDLYKTFCQNTDLLIFKGDLNYRKLTGDLKWPVVTPFKTALRKFQPTCALCSLRTIKADVLVGIDIETAKKIANFPSGWQETGSYAIINFLNNKIN